MTQQDVITEDLILQTKIPMPQDSLQSIKETRDGFERTYPLQSIKEARDDFERTYLIQVLELCEGNVSKAANLAGKHRTDFYDLLKKHNLQARHFKSSQ